MPIGCGPSEGASGGEAVMGHEHHEAEGDTDETVMNVAVEDVKPMPAGIAQELHRKKPARTRLLSKSP